MSDRESAARLYRNAWREAVVVILVWALALLWSVAYCYLRGYEHPPDSWVIRNGLARSPSADNFRSIAGLPEWVMFGIVIPWLACTAFTLIFSRFLMRDDELGSEAEEGAGHGH